MEYRWEAKFDGNGDGDCFSDGDIIMAVLYFRPTGLISSQGPLLQFTQHEVWIVRSGGINKILVPKSSFTVVQSGNKLTMSVAKNADPLLPTINSLTPVRFETTHILGGTTFKDHFPD